MLKNIIINRQKKVSLYQKPQSKGHITPSKFIPIISLSVLHSRIMKFYSLRIKFKRFLLIYIKIYFRCDLQYFYIMIMKSPLTSNDDNLPSVLRNLEIEGALSSKRPSKEESESLCFRNHRKKKILKKPESLLGRLKLESPLSFSNVHNIFNILSINEHALRSEDYEESYFKTMFYHKAIERVELRRHALILQLKPIDNQIASIQYLINRYKSFGDKKFYQLATAIERMAMKLQRQHKEGFTQQLMRSFDGQPLSRFIDSMAGETYMCKVAPNKLVISRGLLEMLGEDPESYAIELCKYKIPLREIISAERYIEIMVKSIQNIGLLCDFMDGRLTHDQLHAQASINFNDYIFDRHHKRIYCSFVLFMPTPQMSCIQMRQIIREIDHPSPKHPSAQTKRKLFDAHCQQQRFSQAEVLKNIIKLPQGLLKHNSKRVACYQDIPSFKK